MARYLLAFLLAALAGAFQAPPVSVRSTQSPILMSSMLVDEAEALLDKAMEMAMKNMEVRLRVALVGTAAPPGAGQGPYGRHRGSRKVSHGERHRRAP